MKKKKIKLQLKRKALEIMGRIYDPFHDEQHALEVSKTAFKIYKHLPPETQKKVDLHSLKLLALLHDTSRKIIGTNIFLEPLMGGYISGRIGFRLMIEAGYSIEEATYIRSIIRNHESFYGLWKYPMDETGKIFADADCIEGYSSKRLERGLNYFNQKKFSNLFLNLYIFSLVFVYKHGKSDYYYEFSKSLEKRNVKKLLSLFLSKKQYFKKVLFSFVYNYLYTLLAV